MDFDEVRAQGTRGVITGEPLATLSIAELTARIATLEAEIARVRAEIQTKKQQADAAHALFKS